METKKEEKTFCTFEIVRHVPFILRETVTQHYSENMSVYDVLYFNELLVTWGKISHSEFACRWSINPLTKNFGLKKKKKKTTRVEEEGEDDKI